MKVGKTISVSIRKGRDSNLPPKKKKMGKRQFLI